MQATKLEKCIYDPATHTIWDVIVNGKTSIGAEDPEAYAAQVGGQIWDLNTAIEHEQNACKTAPARISRGEFLDALEVLPPMHWHSTGRIETFKSSEFYSGIVTAIYCRIGAEYWTFRDCATLSRADIVTRCVAARYGVSVS